MVGISFLLELKFEEDLGVGLFRIFSFFGFL